MVYLSEFIGKPVVGIDGERIGKLQDLITNVRPEVPHPLIVAIVVKQKSDELNIPYQDLAAFTSAAIPLAHPLAHIQAYIPKDNDLYLVRDVLDKPVIDTDDVRVVRVNDLQLMRVNGSLVASNVDISTLGILRRIGLEKMAQRIAKVFGRAIRGDIVSWDDVELLSGQQSIRLKVSREKLAELHPADLANIIGDMNREQSGQLLEALDVKQLADTLEEVEPDFQANLVEGMSDEKVADVLEELAPDEAADLLAELPKERSENLLELMADEEAEDVRKLLTYPENTAGGLMTTDFATVRPNLTAGQAIATLRKTVQNVETLFYVYVTDAEGHLVGVFLLGELIMAQPQKPVAEFMHQKVVKANLLDDQDEVAQLVAKYNLLAVPVVDENNILHGIVTSDDALDDIIPDQWKNRLPHFHQ